MWYVTVVTAYRLYFVENLSIKYHSEKAISFESFQEF